VVPRSGLDVVAMNGVLLLVLNRILPARHIATLLTEAIYPSLAS
jgi:hypothetical protein